MSVVLMLRSDATTRPGRVVGYLFAGCCALALVYSVSVGVWLLFHVDTVSARAWVLATVLTTIVLGVFATVRISRSAGARTYLWLALAYLGLAIVCFLGWAQAVVWY